MKQKWALLACMLMAMGMFAQTATQTVRGKVLDEGLQPLELVTVSYTTDDGKSKGDYTDQDGIYILENVPVGYRTFDFTFVGYKKVSYSDILVTTGKEVILNVEMETDTSTFDAIIIRGKERSGDARNRGGMVSATSLGRERIDRDPGSRADLPRLAAFLPGVQGADDSRNDIVIRGNTPQGLIWRFEGVNIPNPNHFAISGTAGGPLTILNNKYITESDFFTGAFPAEFGNGIAGVFDVRMRNGNDQNHEISAQFGFLGTELFAEGPVSKEKKSSYLASYRYSTLRIFDFLGIPTGTGAVPKYQDGAFRFNFPRDDGGNIAFWGIGGVSRIDVENSKLTPEDLNNPDLYAESDRDQVFKSRMGAVGLTFTKPLKRSAFVKASLSGSTAYNGGDSWKIFRQEKDSADVKIFVIDSFPLPHFLAYDLREDKLSGYLSLYKSLIGRTDMKVGINVDYFSFSYLDSFRVARFYEDKDPVWDPWRVRWNTKGENAVLVQPYLQFKKDIGRRLTAVAGLTALYFSLNENSLSPVEPRLGLKYYLDSTQYLSLGYGLHSQIVPPYIYFYGNQTNDQSPQLHNRDLGLFKSHHLLLGYDLFFGEAMRLKLETYYQHLFNIPVEKERSAFSLVNTGSGFDRLFPDELVNEGTGRNYGFDASLSRFFKGGYYFLLTGSVFDSKYRGSDDTLRNTTFNGRFTLNGVVAKEFKVGKKGTFNMGAKVTYLGGRWRGLVDSLASVEIQDIVYRDYGMNSIQLRPYFRADIKATFRWNRPKAYHEFSIDLVNIFNYENLLLLTYVPNHPSGEPIQETNQLKFLPIFYYKLDFSLDKEK